ncbi:MAG TPA: xylulokinase [Chloroflexota bacterium]|nr:xylulokinase [Chloroflexota bacterium]
MAFLGLDLGTTGVRALLIDGNGAVLGSDTAEHPLHSPAPGWMEQDPEDWWRAAAQAVRGALERAGLLGEAVAAAAVSGQMHGAVLLDAAGQVVRPCILWNDQRSVAQCEEIMRRVGRERMLAITGNVALAGFTAPKLLWVREHEPQRWARVAQVLLPRDYLNYRLTGILASEPSDAAGTLLFDVRARQWSPEILAALALDAALLPHIVPSAGLIGGVSAAAARTLGLREGTPVMGGGADNACAAAGNGVLEPGQVLCSVGTSGTVVAPVGLNVGTPGSNVHLFSHVSPRVNYLMGVVLSAGGALRWFRDTCAPELATHPGAPDHYDVLTAEAARTPPGAEGLIFLPYLTGERTPHGSADARGVFFGLSPRHGRGHLARAVIEGVSLALGQSFALLRGAGVRAEVVRLTGGGARSPFWRQILADVFECPVALQPRDEGPAYGAALLAAVGAGAFPDIESAGRLARPTEQVDPRPETSAIYRGTAELYAELYHALEPLYPRRMALEIAGSMR